MWEFLNERFEEKNKILTKDKKENKPTTKKKGKKPISRPRYRSRKKVRNQYLDHAIDQEKKQVLRYHFFFYKFPPLVVDIWLFINARNPFLKMAMM